LRESRKKTDIPLTQIIFMTVTKKIRRGKNCFLKIPEPFSRGKKKKFCHDYFDTKEPSHGGDALI
jgi:hypothetical protein